MASNFCGDFLIKYFAVHLFFQFGFGCLFLEGSTFHVSKTELQTLNDHLLLFRFHETGPRAVPPAEALWHFFEF